MTVPFMAKTRFVELDPIRSTFRVRRDAYRSHEIHEQERELVFGRCWLYIGHDSEIERPGDFVRRRIVDRDLIFVRDRKHNVHALYNSCSHRGVAFCREPKGSARVFTCPYHGWVFGTDGALKGKGLQGGYPEDFNADGRYDLLSVERLEQYRGFWFINLNRNAIGLREYLAGATDVLDLMADQTDDGHMVLNGVHEYTIDANYKLLAENSIDASHAPETHRSYFEFLTDRLRETEGQNAVDKLLSDYSSGTTGAGLGNGHGWMGGLMPTGRPVAAWIPPWGPEAKTAIDDVRTRLIDRFGQDRAMNIAERQRNLVIFPNLVVNDHVAITIRMFQPEGPNRMRVLAWALGPKEEVPLLRRIRLDNYLTALGPAGFVTPDDNEMLGLAQRGMEHTPGTWSDMSRGLNPDVDPRVSSGSWDEENQMRAYWAQWDQLMGGVETLESR